MKILFLSHTPIGGSFVVGSHHLAKEFVQIGHEVAHLSPPVTPAHLLFIKKPFERQRFKRWLSQGALINGVHDLIPASFLPWGLARRIGKPFFTFGQAVNASALKLLVKHGFNQPDLIFIDEPRLGFLLNSFPKARIIYRPTDLYAEIRNDLSILDAEHEVIQRSHAFIATSQPVAEHLQTLGVKDVLVIENGVELNHFMNGPDFDVDAELPSSPRAVYAGALDHRFGVDSIIEAAKLNPNLSFVLIGPANAIIRKAFENSTNIVLLGSVPYERLPSYLRRCQVALLPLSNDPSNRGRSPMKLFEYAALGLPVIATQTEELARRNLPFVSLAQDPIIFAAEVSKAIYGQSKNEIASVAQECALSQAWRTKCEHALHYAMGTADEY